MQKPLDWLANGTPVSTRFADPYYSMENGLAETRHVFHDGNDLPARFRPGFRIAELGFGTGLNFLATRALWRASGQPGPLRFTSFEAFPLSAGDMARAIGRWDELAPLAEEFLARWTGDGGVIDFGDVRLEIVVGDARRTLPAWEDRADAWFLDGFSPARNPELWGPELMAAVAAHTVPGGSFATYSAAGHVRRSLSAAGFEVSRRPGYGKKRDMSVGRLPGQACTTGVTGPE